VRIYQNWFNSGIKECEKILEYGSALGWKELQRKKTYENVVSSCVVEGIIMGSRVEERACEV